MKTLAPSILASNMLELGNEIKKIENSGAKYVHIDVMDGSFVPNISFGMPIISCVRNSTNLILDVHAMIINPDKYIDTFIDSGADIVTFHIEALDNEGILKSIERVHKRGKRVGISLKPATPAEIVFPYLHLIDMVLVMTVEPGFGGQSFMHDMMQKVRKIKKTVDEKSLSVDIQVDGGINSETIKLANESGANIFVLGTAFFKSEEPLRLESLLGE